MAGSCKRFKRSRKSNEKTMDPIEKLEWHKSEVLDYSALVQLCDINNSMVSVANLREIDTRDKYIRLHYVNTKTYCYKYQETFDFTKDLQKLKNIWKTSTYTDNKGKDMEQNLRLKYVNSLKPGDSFNFVGGGYGGGFGTRQFVKRDYVNSNLILRFMPQKGETDASWIGINQVLIPENFTDNSKISLKGSGMKLKELATNFLEEHGNTLFMILVIAVIDHLLFDGALRSRLKGSVESLIEKLPGQNK